MAESCDQSMFTYWHTFFQSSWNDFLLFFFFWLGWVFVAVHGLSLVAVIRGYSSLTCAGFSLWWLLLLQSMGSRVQAQYLWCRGLGVLWHEESSWTRDRTCVACISRRILNHWPSRSLGPLFLKDHFTLSSLSSDLKTFSFLLLTDDCVSHLNENIQGITREFQHPLTHIYQSVAPVNFLCYKRNLFLCSYTSLLTPDVFPPQAILQFSADSNCCPTI